jgi:peptidyl-tRNA hydrolase, PTH1 family
MLDFLAKYWRIFQRSKTTNNKQNGPQERPNEDVTMKYLIAGLGNMGHQYDGTRHNIGFDVVDVLARQLEGQWRSDSHGDLAEVRHKGRTLILLKPDTYMNLSGKAVRYWAQKEKIPMTNLLVICDDLNLPFGKIRLRPNGSDGGHNGLKSIQELLATNAYPRLRMGISADFGKGKQANYVLGPWTDDEAAGLAEFTERAADAVKTFAAIGLDRAMNLYNK